MSFPFDTEVRISVSYMPCLTRSVNSILNAQFVEVDCPKEYFIFITFELNSQCCLLNPIHFDLLVNFYQSLP